MYFKYGHHLIRNISIFHDVLFMSCVYFVLCILTISEGPSEDHTERSNPQEFCCKGFKKLRSSRLFSLQVRDHVNLNGARD